MIVHTMTPEEIAAEVMDDQIAIMKLFTVKLQIHTAQMLRTHNKRWVETIHVKSKRNNDWSMAVNFSPLVQEMVFYVKTYDKTGLVAYNVNMFDDQIPLLVKYSSHFLKRYNERMHLGITKADDVLKHFFKSNTKIIPACSNEDMSDGGRLSFFSFNKGIGLGRFYPEQLTVHMCTFVADDTLSKNQQDRVKILQQEEIEGGFYKKSEFIAQAKHHIDELAIEETNSTKH